MDSKRHRLKMEVHRNEKRIEECMAEAEILENRNLEIKKELADG